MSAEDRTPLSCMPGDVLSRVKALARPPRSCLVSLPPVSVPNCFRYCLQSLKSILLLRSCTLRFFFLKVFALFSDEGFSMYAF